MSAGRGQMVGPENDGGFQITKRHYDIIMHQVKANHPQEAGGFVGGKNGLITAILPLFNKHLFNKTDTFVVHQDDMDRAHRFFQKHKCEYYGVYHSHPNGAPIPSQADIDTGQKYHFIIGAANPDAPILTAWHILPDKTPINLSMEVVSDDNFKVADINAKGEGSTSSVIAPRSPLHEAAEELSEKIDSIKKSKKINYRKNKSHHLSDSEFNTLA